MTPQEIDHIADSVKKVSIPCAQENDVIFRKAAIDALWKALYEYEDETEKQFLESEELDVGEWIGHRIFVQNMNDIDRQTILNLPSAQPETQWIPVERELPEDLAEVNVTWVNHEPESYYEPIKSKPFTASAVYYEGNWYWYSSVCADVLAEYGRNDVDKVDDAIEITAWKPLPEPYQGCDE